MNRVEVEKALKRYLKRGIGYSTTILVVFLINGAISLGEDIKKELQIQDLLKSIKLEKKEVKEKLLELEKELAIVKNSENYSTHFLFSPKIEHRHSKKSKDNGFNGRIDNWEDSIKEEPNIDIPDIRDNVEPDIEDIPNPLPNEDSIVKVPDFEFDNVGNVSINDEIPNIDLKLEGVVLPKNDINEEDFYLLTDDEISKPDIELDDVVNVGLVNSTQIIKTEPVAPVINDVIDLSTFIVGEITVNAPSITTPDSFSLDTVKIETGSFKQGHDTDYVANEEAPDGTNGRPLGGEFYILQNYLNYSTEKNSDGTEGLNVWVHADGIFYDTYPKNKYIHLTGPNGEDIRLGHAWDNKETGGFANRFGKNYYVTSFISDVIGQDTSVNGKYNYIYEGNRQNPDKQGIEEDDYTKQYVRMFFSNSSAGLFDVNSENIKITKFDSELNLSTTNALPNKYPNINGYLIGIEHQLWDEKDSFTTETDKNTVNLYSNLLNLGTINIGNNLFETNAIDTNMIGIMIDLAKGTIEAKGNHKTINAGSINILNGKNNIGLSFEEYGAGNEKGAMLRDDVYIGKINVGDNTNNNYAFKMGNIYGNSFAYFDKTKIIGNLNKVGSSGSIIINNDRNETEVVENYISDIVVAGTQNAGMVVGKSLSDSANSNPIANFENIFIKVDGDQTIGFIRDKNYSDNNKNDMVITDSNLNKVRFGANAKNSVLFRSEMYGITNETTINVTPKGDEATTTKEKISEEDFNITPTYNVAMQATVETWDKDGTKINSSGSVTNGENGTIISIKENPEDDITDYIIGMMASGTITNTNASWQNGDNLNNGKALATNKGTISLTGSNNIGIAIIDSNKGNNSGTITISGANGVGVYNTGTFENKGTTDKKATVNVNGKNGIGIYNNNILALDNSTVSIGGENSVGLYSEGGTIDFGLSRMLLENEVIYRTTIQGDGNSAVGIYTTKNKTSSTGEEENNIPDVTLKGEVSIDGTKVGLVSDSGLTKIEAGGNIGYSGSGFALQTINNGKIIFDSNSTLTLGGSAYGFDIDVADKNEVGKYVNFNGAKIEIKSNDVTIFNINGRGEEYEADKIMAGDDDLPGEEYLEKFVGEIGAIEDNGNLGYKIASIENGNILLNSISGNNEEFLKKYKFQKSIVNMSTDTNLSLTNTEADTYFSGEVIGIGISSNTSKAETPTTIEDTQINIGNSTLTANRIEEAPKVSEDENSSTKSTIGAYIDYGRVNVTNGKIIVENDPRLKIKDNTNNNGIGIFSKNGSKVTIDEDSSITVYGNNGIGIYAEATKEFYTNEDGVTKNKFGGDITKLDIVNAGAIDVSSGTGGVGIFADGDTGEDNRGIVINSGAITVNGGTEESSSVGIYGINVDITNTGNIQVGCQHNEETENHTGVGIYAKNSNVTIGDEEDKNSKVEITLGDFATGIHLDGDSNLTLNGDLVFNSLKTQDIINTTDRIGIYAESKNNENVKDISINHNIDMSDVVGGKAVVVDGRAATLSEGKEIRISGNNGRGLRILDDGTTTNEGKIIIGELNQIEENAEFKGASIGMVAANINGNLANEGTIDINSANGIGIYVDNSNTDRERYGNQITSVGTINLNGDKNIGVVAKEFDLKFGGEDNLTTRGITFGNSNGIGVYAENSNVTINENIIRTFEENQINNILIAGIGNEKIITNNNTITLEGEGKNNIGVYLGEGTQYKNGENGSIVINNGNIGIYADKGSGTLENINIISDSKGVQTIGVILNGEDKEIKTISGNITLTNTSDIVQGKNLGIYADNSSVVVNEKDILTLHNAKSNGTGLYLNNSTLLGSGTVKITGEGKVNSEGKIPNSVGIYYASNSSTGSSKNSTSGESNEITVIVDKSNTIGVYVANGSTLTKQSTGGIIVGDSKEVSNVTGLVASNNSIINNEGNVTLNDTLKSIGLASLGGTINNSGVITLGEKTESGTGVFLTGNSNFDNEIGTIQIDSEGNENGVGIGVYTNGESVTIGNTGNFNMKKGNIAIYSDGTNISSNINLLHKDEDNNVLDINSGTTALVVKSDIKSEEDGIVKGTTVGGESADDKMNITLAKGSTGIYVLDSGVKLSNLSINANAHNENTNDLSYGIYLHSEENGNYNITNTDISLVKGVGIVVNTDTDKKTSLILRDSTLNVDSYSEGDEAETGIGIYNQSGNITLAGGNTINTTYGVGVFGGSGSDISIGIENEEDKKDTLNLIGYSVGVYSNGGSVTLGTDTDIIFQKGQDYGQEKEITSKGVGAYVIDGSINSSANINLAQGNDKANGIIGILGKQTSNNNVTITNEEKGDINLSGSSVTGIVGIGNENYAEKVTITNNGNIEISGTTGNLSTGIYGENTDIINGGNITVGSYAVGIYSTGTKTKYITNNGNITLSGENNIGAFLSGNTGKVSLGDIEIEQGNNFNRNLGVYLNNYTSSNTEIGNISLGDYSMGLYINNSSTTIDSLGDITVGIEGRGIASIGTRDENNTIDDNIIIKSNGNISVGETGTAIYVQDSNLTMEDSSALGKITVEKDGVLLHANGGIIDFKNNDTTLLEVTNGNIGMILENGGDITTSKQEISNITVTGGGTGILIKGENTGRPDILADETTINLGSGVYTITNNGIKKYKYSVGAYYQGANLDNDFNINISRQDNSDHTIGTIYDRTYGTINDFNTTMNDTISDSIGTIIRREGTDIIDDTKTVILNAGEDGILASIDGSHNIGIAGKNSIIEANGNIKVGLNEKNTGSIGVYLTGTDSKWTHSYTGNGNIEVGSNSYGIYAKNYDVTHNGNISASGNGSIGIAGITEDGNDCTLTINNGTIKVENSAIGVFGRDTDIEVTNGNLNISEDSTTGIASLKNGNITFDGSANISGTNSTGIYKNTVGTEGESSNTITVGEGEWNIGDLSNGIVAISREKDENGNITATGNSIAIDSSSNMTLGDGAIGIYSTGANTVKNTGDISVGGAVIEEDKTYTSAGIYMANGVGGVDNRVTGTNSGTITVANNGGVGIQIAGYVDFTNSGDINVSKGGEGLHASYSAIITNEGNITVTGKGTGMIAKGEGSQAINNGTITLEKDDSMLNAEELANQYNISLIGMVATNGGYIENNGTININDGIGMYVDKNSSLVNNGTLEVNNGIGILGTGELKNKGTIHINSSTAIDIINKDLDEIGSLVVDREEGILEVNDNFSNIGGILETDYNIKLNNPTIDITVGGAGFIAPNVSGDIKLDSNFALEGDGLSFSVEDFIAPEADVNINTSPLFKTDINEGDLTVNKVDYKDITVGTQFDNRDNALDDILAGGGVDADILKNLNYYLDSLGNTTLFNSEANRLLGAVGGNIYSNLQSRMQDISRNFDSSFVEMIESENPTYENSKYHLIYTEGDYKNSNKNVINYDYNIIGLNYMKEYDLTEQGQKYGYTFGFTGTKFKFDDFSGSEEDVYSLRGGVYRVNYFDNGVSWLTRTELGYNHHRVERKVNIPNVNINNRDWFGSYQVSLDNRLRKEIFTDENSNFGTYTALNLEYGLFDDIKEKGNLELKVKSNDYFSSKAMLGLDGKFSKPLNDSWSIRLNGDVNYSYDFGNNYDENEAKFRSNGNYYSLSSELKSRDVISGRLSIALDKSDYFTISLHGQASTDFRRDEDYWNVGLTFIYRFNHYAVPEKFLDMCTYFEFDKSEIKAKDKENIKEMAEYINENNMQGTLLIEGHTDDKGSNSYNDNLSLERANSVKEEFEKSLNNNDNIQIKVMGYGENRPAYKNINESARSKNRRAQVNILNK